MGLMPLLLGEAPGPSGGTHDPLGSKTAKRLCGFAGWEPEVDGGDPYRAALAKRFELRNVLDRPTESNGKGTRFPQAEARAAAERLPLEERIVVCLGKRVAAAVGASGTYFRWVRVGTSIMVTIPHPSGINRVLNDPAKREEAGRTLRIATTL